MKAIILTLTFFAIGPSGLSNEGTATNWPQNFRYGELHLDFRNRSATNGPHTASLTDCSNSEFYCASSKLFSFVLPRKCHLKMAVGDQWRIGSIQTRVVGALDEPVGHLGAPGGTLYIVQTDGNPHTALLYKPSAGPVAAFYDPEDSLDFSWTKPKGAGKFETIFSQNRLLRSYSQDESASSVAICSN
jgi:hypothetical protein